MRIWLNAARPRTLPAAIAPVLVGTAAAVFVADKLPSWSLFVAALVASILIQIGTNLANDYSDARRGADSADRLGPVRVTSAGLITPQRVLTATWIAFGLAALLGIYIASQSDWIILAVGAVSIAAGFLYTGGPKPYGYAGLGELVVFLFFDLAFLGANLLKIVDGGWFTLSLALAVLTVMVTWRDGRAYLARHYANMRMPVDAFLRSIAEYRPQRTSGTAVFMSISPEGVPHTLLHHFKHNEALHERVVLLSIVSAEVPQVEPDERLAIEDLGQGFHRILARYGYMETPRVPEILELATRMGLPMDVYSTSFYLGRETLLTTGDAPMAQWRKKLFVFMSRNSWNATSFFGIPPGRVVELGNQVEI